MNENRELLEKFLSELFMFFQETGVFLGYDSDLRAGVESACSRIKTCLSLVQPKASRPVVALVGMTNVGKSTLLNALFGSNIAPRRNGPCTAVPIEFQYAPQYSLQVEYNQSIDRPVSNFSSVEELQQHLKALADDSGAEQSQLIQCVVVKCPDELLRNGLVLGDTPGFGAAQLGDASGSHEAALKTYIQDNVTRVFWIVRADQCIGSTEIKFYEKFIRHLCDDIIVTGCEDWTPDEKKRLRDRVLPELKKPQMRFHFVSGKMGLKALKENDSEMYAQSGMEKLRQEFLKIDPHESGAVEMKLEALVDDLVYWLQKKANKLGRPAHGWFPPHCWINLQDEKKTPGPKEIKEKVIAKLKSLND